MLVLCDLKKSTLKHQPLKMFPSQKKEHFLWCSQDALKERHEFPEPEGSSAARRERSSNFVVFHHFHGVSLLVSWQGPGAPSRCNTEFPFTVTCCRGTDQCARFLCLRRKFSCLLCLDKHWLGYRKERGFPKDQRSRENACYKEQRLLIVRWIVRW